jgi:hypothetical protein
LCSRFYPSSGGGGGGGGGAERKNVKFSILRNCNPSLFIPNQERGSVVTQPGAINTALHCRSAAAWELSNRHQHPNQSKQLASGNEHSKSGMSMDVKKKKKN